MTELAKKIEEAIRVELSKWCYSWRLDEEAPAIVSRAIMSRITPLLGAGLARPKVTLDAILEAIKPSTEAYLTMRRRIEELFASAPAPPSEPQLEEVDSPDQPGEWERAGVVYYFAPVPPTSRTLPAVVPIASLAGGVWRLFSGLVQRGGWRRLPSAFDSDELARLRRELDDEKNLRLHYQFAPMGDNHHNALMCPYCSPKANQLIKEHDDALRKLAAAEQRFKKLVDEIREHATSPNPIPRDVRSAAVLFCNFADKLALDSLHPPSGEPVEEQPEDKWWTVDVGDKEVAKFRTHTMAQRWVDANCKQHSNLAAVTIH